MIYYFTPYHKDGLYKAYDTYMLLLKDDDWAVFMDGDAMFLGEKWGEQIETFIEKNEDAGLITCLTNRSGYIEAQGFNKRIWPSPDVIVWRKIAKDLEKKSWLKSTKLDIKVTGFFMMINKKVWDTHIKTDTPPKGNLGIDDYISERILESKLPLLRMDGVLVFHYFRLLEGLNYTKHLK